MAEKSTLTYFVTSAATKKPTVSKSLTRSSPRRFKRLTAEPQNLWPGQRGTEIGHLSAKFSTVEFALRRLTPAKDGAVYEYPDQNMRAILLKGLAGQRMISIVEEAVLAPGMLSIVADAKADPAPILDALRQLLAGTADLHASAPDRPFTA